MRKVLLFGNSGSGKSTLALQLKNTENLAHLDLDTLAWLDSSPPQRAPLEQSRSAIDDFIQANDAWVIEGCYADLLALASPAANEVIFLNIPIEQCIANARNRPWEPHKYPSKEAQDANLDMLIDWIKDYENRDDVFSQKAHLALFDDFEGTKRMTTGNRQENAQ